MATAQRDNRRLSVLVRKNPGVSMEAAIFLSIVTGHRIAGNRRLHKALNESTEWKSVKKAFPCWTGTFFAYDCSKEKNGDTIEYDFRGIRYVYRVPEESRDHCSFLFTEPGHYDLEVDGKTIIIHAKADGVELPAWASHGERADNGWFRSSDYGTPNGPAGRHDQDAIFVGPLEWKAVGLMHRHQRYLGLHSANVFDSGVIVDAEGAVQELDVQNIDGECRIKGIDWERIRALCAGDASLGEISEGYTPEELTAIRQLMPLLEERDYVF